MLKNDSFREGAGRCIHRSIQGSKYVEQPLLVYRVDGGVFPGVQGSEIIGLETDDEATQRPILAVKYQVIWPALGLPPLFLLVVEQTPLRLADQFSSPPRS